MINSIHSVNRSCYNGQKRQGNESFKGITVSPETKQKAAEIGQDAAKLGTTVVVETFKFGIKTAPVVKKATVETFGFFKRCFKTAQEELKKP
ncbi:MAG: hypothetical protein PHC34_06995 [Candidatus Gastranaerophilales bacterium]|nr:hypothetical protein [Candidatus Gastranaerophilales bacterium]